MSELLFNRQLYGVALPAVVGLALAALAWVLVRKRGDLTAAVFAGAAATLGGGAVAWIDVGGNASDRFWTVGAVLVATSGTAAAMLADKPWPRVATAAAAGLAAAGLTYSLVLPADPAWVKALPLLCLVGPVSAAGAGRALDDVAGRVVGVTSALVLAPVLMVACTYESLAVTAGAAAVALLVLALVPAKADRLTRGVLAAGCGLSPVLVGGWVYRAVYMNEWQHYAALIALAVPLGAWATLALRRAGPTWATVAAVAISVLTAATAILWMLLNADLDAYNV